MNRKVIRTVLLTALGTYAAIFVYQRYQRNLANKAIDSEMDAIKKLEEARRNKWF
jgi:hypothetical protein